MQSHTTQLLAQETSSSRAKARTVILYQNVYNLWIRDLGPAPIMAPMVQWRLSTVLDGDNVLQRYQFTSAVAPFPRGLL